MTGRATGREFLDQFQQNHKSTVANMFHHAVRAGANSDAAVLDAVREDVSRRLSSPWVKDEWRPALCLLGSALPTEAAVAYAQYVLDYERLSLEEKGRIKAARGEEHKTAWMEQQPASEAQISYLRKLGFAGPAPASKAEASNWIDRLRNGR